jgi:hypothetical protein
VDDADLVAMVGVASGAERTYRDPTGKTVINASA